MKKILVVLTVIVSCIVINQSFSGCASNEPVVEAMDTEVKSPEENSIAFSNSFKEAYGTFLKTEAVVKDPQSRSVGSEDGNYTTIYLAIPEDEEVDLKNINTIGEVHELIRDLEIDYGFTPFPEGNDSIIVDNSEIDEAFVVMIAESKNYLHGLGIDERSIQDELLANDIEERTLVPTALAMLEYQENRILYNDVEFVDDSLFTIIGYAPSRAVNIDWAKAMKCAIKAIGVDVVKDLMKNGVKGVSVQVFKKVLRNAASKFAGPIGVAFVVWEFSDCYWNIL